MQLHNEPAEASPSSSTAERSRTATPPTADESPVAPCSRVLFWSFVLCLLGVAVSIELTRIHLFVHTDPSYHSVCALSEGINCETVAASPYSVFAGLPVSVWGILGYLWMGALSLWGWTKWRLHSSWPLGLLLVLAFVSVAASAFLAFISATQIDSLCFFCMMSYAINLALLTICVAAWRRSRSRLFTLLFLDVTGLFGRPLSALALVLTSTVALGATKALVPSYWKAPGWTDLPQLPFGNDDRSHHWIGAPTPRLTIVEFSDYECPHCRAAHKNMRLLAGKYPDRIRLVHRHLPLDMACHPRLNRPFHQRACEFAEAAECAGQQGRFWEMNDAIFSSQDTIKAKDLDLMEIAIRLGLNRPKFRDCLRTHAVSQQIAQDLEEAVARGLNGTPSFLLGQRVFTGRIPEAELLRLLEEPTTIPVDRKHPSPSSTNVGDRS